VCAKARKEEKRIEELRQKSRQVAMTRSVAVGEHRIDEPDFAANIQKVRKVPQLQVPRAIN